jgi:hypothetical protein
VFSVQYTYSVININLLNYSCNCICCSSNCTCIVFIVCSMSFIVCVVSCVVFCLSVILCDLCYLCVVPYCSTTAIGQTHLQFK